MGMSPLLAATILPLVVLWPLLAAVIAGVLAKSGCSRRVFDVFVTLSAGLSLVSVVGLIAPVLAESRVVGALPFGLDQIEFAADPVGLLFALAAALVWFCATLYATAWLREDPAPVRFQVTSLALLSANLGVVLAGDLLTLYVCFEVLGLGALLLVVHDGTETARRAGVKYFWMTILGGIALLAGILAFYALTGSTAIDATAPSGDGSPLLWAAFVLLLVGFGVKAGMMPLHIWLPDAHPVAPPPASALLSGVMIKTGAYGIFRVLNTLFSGDQASGDQVMETLQPWLTTSRMGLIVTWLGLVTMLLGVVMALGQRQAKRLLAWSSVSQMGFVLTGLGAGAWLGADGAMASAGGLLHVFNHGLFKGALFLGAGAVAMQAGTADMGRLGGLWRQMPFTFGCMLVAAAGITGIPLFNGFVSKSLIHHGLVEAIQQGGMLPVAEWIFLAGSVGTFAALARFIGLVFVRRPQAQTYLSVREAPTPMLAGMLVLTLPVIVVGIHPHWLLEGLIAPGLAVSGVAAEPVAYYLSHYFLGAADLGSSAAVAAAGMGVLAIGIRYRLFDLRAPAWVGVDFWYRAAGRNVVRLCYRLSETSADAGSRIQRAFGNGARWLDAALDRPGPPAKLAADHDFERLDELRDCIQASAERIALDTAGENRQFEREQLLDSVHWMSGLLATRMLEQAMDSFGRTNDRVSVEKWLSAADSRCEKLAQAALDLSVAWLDGAKIDGAGLQATLRDMLPPLPAPSDTRVQGEQRNWIGELNALIFQPGQPHWPVTEGLDRGRLAARLRRYLEVVSRNLSLALALVFALLALLLLRSVV